MRIKKVWLIVFLLPGLLLYATFFLVPALASLGVSLTNWSAGQPVRFVGLQNYFSLLQDTVFHSAVRATLLFSVTVIVCQSVLALAFALLLVKNTKLNVAYRTIYFVPTIIASVSIAFAWQFMMGPTTGWINHVLGMVGLSGWQQNWLGSPHIAIFSLAFIQFWTHAGQVMLLYIVGLQAIPRELYEVADIEGASMWQRFRKVTWPLLAPSAVVAVVYTTIQSFKVFDFVVATTAGGPGFATDVFPFFIYQESFIDFHYGYAEAAAVIFLGFMILITLIQFIAMRRKDVVIQ